MRLDSLGFDSCVLRDLGDPPFLSDGRLFRELLLTLSFRKLFFHEESLLDIDFLVIVELGSEFVSEALILRVLLVLDLFHSLEHLLYFGAHFIEPDL